MTNDIRGAAARDREMQIRMAERVIDTLVRMHEDAPLDALLTCCDSLLIVFDGLIPEDRRQEMIRRIRARYEAPDARERRRTLVLLGGLAASMEAAAQNLVTALDSTATGGDDANGSAATTDRSDPDGATGDVAPTARGGDQQ